MPIVNIDLWAGRTAEIKEKLIKKVTETVCETVGCPSDAVIVVIRDVPKENWGQNGKQASK
ncbi:MAG TPA: 2-hydroxymuconate tautomerase [Candidatus Omnitrophota bacterium]|nr:2-hydroxymuconate tautomerase [Candidatus Omnitrophota bacterium]